MISQINGHLIEIIGNTIVVDVGGIGYELELTTTALDNLPPISSDLILYTHFVVREDAQLLYGFSTLSEREVFRSLIRINGVGPKLALSILSSISITQLAKCVVDNDPAVLTQVPGVGRKTAERLLVDLKNKLDQDLLKQVPLQDTNDRDAIHEAEVALVGLGYKNGEAKKAVRDVYSAGATSEFLIKAALKAAASAAGAQ